ncbi:DUF5683 domain-containing protein [Rhodohalobacter sp.]|uniref:DUF5683 domain-containing protein n=1 Tax=Rhodohalobacter sp. TaxID=1974210 RepID=UPI003563BCE1
MLENRISSQDYYSSSSNDSLNQQEYPKPKAVMLKSLMIPGWGQIENKQTWKVPIIYGLFAGIGYYTITLNNDYKDYKAAYYNSFPDNDDMRFGPTPEYLQGVNANQLQSNRNSLRNQRDFMFVVMGLAYGLNVIDAYVFAHMRSFDVSDDLSANAVLHPTMIENRSPGISLKINLQNRN